MCTISFPRRRCSSSSRASPSLTSSPRIVVHGGFGVFNDIIPAQIADLASRTRPMHPPSSAASADRSAALPLLPAFPAAQSTRRSAPTTHFRLVPFGRRTVRWHPAGRADLPLAVSLNTFPSGTLKTPYYYQYNFGIEQQIGARGNLRADFVGTRGLHEPYQVQLNGYQTVCAGCFAPFPYQRPSTSASATSMSSAPMPTATTPACRPPTPSIRGFTLRGNYTLSHCLDEVSNGGLLAFSTQGIISPLPGELSRQYGNCDYDVRHNISAYGLYQIPFHSKHALLRQIFGGWSFSETAFLHSGLPFTVLSQPYTANGNGVFQSERREHSQFNAPSMRTAFRACRSTERLPIAGVTVAGTKQWLNPNAFVSVVDPTTGALHRRRFAGQLPVWRLRPQHRARPAFTDSDIYLTKTFPIWEGITLRLDAQMFNAFNHPNFALPSEVEAGVPGESFRPRFGTLESTISPPTGLLGVGLGGDSSPA